MFGRSTVPMGSMSSTVFGGGVAERRQIPTLPPVSCMAWVRRSPLHVLGFPSVKQNVKPLSWDQVDG